MEDERQKDLSLQYKELRQLISITKDKKQRLQSLLNMTVMQLKAIEGSDMDLLNKYIQEKQRHINAINDLDLKFTNIYDEEIRAQINSGNFPPNKGPMNDLYKELQSLIREVQKLIESIHVQEKDNRAKTEDTMKEIKQKIGHIQLGKKSHNAYARPEDISQGIYIDKKN